MNKICSDLGIAIRKRRNELNYSQEKLAEKSKLHRTYISDVERGNRNVTIITLSKILLALDLFFQEFFSIYYSIKGENHEYKNNE
jgi:transcriptional regulator with XRE-family HTH domain